MKYWGCGNSSLRQSQSCAVAYPESYLVGVEVFWRSLSTVASEKGVGHKHPDLSFLSSDLLRVRPIGWTQLESRGLVGSRKTSSPRETEVESEFVGVTRNYSVYVRNFTDHCGLVRVRKPCFSSTLCLLPTFSWASHVFSCLVSVLNQMRVWWFLQIFPCALENDTISVWTRKSWLVEFEGRQTFGHWGHSYRVLMLTLSLNSKVTDTNYVTS